MIIFNSDGTQLLSVEVNDNSYRNRRIMGDHNLTLYFSLAEHIEIPVGAYCEFEAERYTLERPENLKMKHNRNFEYTVVFESPEAKAKRWKFRNTVDGRLRFPLTAKPREHLEMFVENMNRRDSGWSVGDCIEGVEVLISYDHIYCYEALALMASELNTEFEMKNKRVSLRKVEYNKSNPLALSYGCGNGFKSGVSRSNDGETQPTEILFVQGGSENIDASKYGSTELLLPAGMTLGYDGEHFEGQEGYDASKARIYVVDSEGLSIHRQDKPFSSYAEDSLDCSQVYPKRVGTVSSVVVADADKHFYDIVDSSIPAELNYNDYLIAGEAMTIIFQSGMLAGDSREFEVKYIHSERRFEILPQEIDGQTMPNATFCPREGDKYAVFKCTLPDAYIRNDSDRSGASWDMFREAVKSLYGNEEHKFSFKGELDGIWAKKDWVNIGGRIVLGGYILFSDRNFQREGVLVRIVGIKDYINNPHSPEIELSNSVVGTGFSSTIKQLQAEEVLVEEYHRDAIRFTQRRYRDAKETMAMLEESLLENFTESINPIAVQTMQMIAGDESLQFRFIKSLTNYEQVADTVVWDDTTKQLTIGASCIQHLTLGIKTLSSSHETADYKKWSLPAFTSAVLTAPSAKYYLYAKCSRSGQSGEFILSETPYALDMGDFYYLLVGILNSEYEGSRSYASLYGYSEVLPGRMTTDRIVSGDGQSFFDMLNNAMKLGQMLDFNTRGDGRLRLKGTIVQSQGGEAESPLGCFRGEYNDAYTYYNGDEVTFVVDNVKSTYRHIGEHSTQGVAPTETAYWEVKAQGVKGDKGDQGERGEQGEQGIQGETGADGRTTYFHIKYAPVENPTSAEMTETPSEFIGAYVDFTEADSDDPADYTWSRFEGLQGEQGIAGVNGEDGKTSYLHIKYSDDAGQTFTSNKGLRKVSFNSLRFTSGGGFRFTDSNLGEVGGKYIGTYVDFEPLDSTDPFRYKWVKIAGDDGLGIGKVEEFYLLSANATGVTAETQGWSTNIQTPTAQLKYLWNYEKITYSDGTSSSTTPAVVVTYVKDGKGIASIENFYQVSDDNTEAPTTWQTEIPTLTATNRFLWNYEKITYTEGEPTTTTPAVIGVYGDKGDRGIQGETGADGRTSYLHIAYANSADGSQGFSVSDATGKEYMGQYTDFEEADSTDYTKYKWSKIKGEQGLQGEQGIQGESGEDGRTSYFHIKYSPVQSPTAAQMTETPSTYIGTYVDFTEADSNDPSKYVWSRFEGLQGEQGIAGINGEDGRTSYLHIKYSNDGGQTFSSNKGLRKASTTALRFLGNGGMRFTDSNLGEVEGEYIGTYVDYEPQDSSDVFRYKWAKIKGDKGEAGDYYEYRYAKNGSTSTPPELDKQVLAPNGWTTTVPVVGELEYLWVTIAKISGDGQTLLQAWSDPTRFTPKDGVDGKQGYSPALVFRGEYEANAVYYGNQYRVDAVKYNNTYYVARVDAGTFSGTLPTSGTKWNSFGATFESVATNLLLAENANIAGWIFRNNRLESQSGKVYLDGVTGQVRLAGTIQLSTGYTGNISDKNLFYLPATTSQKQLTMGHEAEDVGKVCRLFNSSPLGGANYLIYVCAYGIVKNSSGGTTTDATIGSDKGMNYYVVVPPQSTVELTCYELPKTFDGTTWDIVARWDVTSRFDQDNFKQSGALGRFPRALAIGTMTGSSSGVSVSGKYYDGRDLYNVFTVSRIAEGQYKFVIKSGSLPSGYMLFATGTGESQMKATVYQHNTTTFYIHISDDASENDGSCNFMILDPLWWYNLQ